MRTVGRRVGVSGAVALWLGVQAFQGRTAEMALVTPLLRRLGCLVAEHGEGLLVTPPSWRVDIDAEHDLIEEVIRIHGFENVPAVPVPRPTMPHPILTPAQRRVNFVRRDLAARGLFEAVTWSFLPKAHAALFGGGRDEMDLANPITPIPRGKPWRATTSGGGPSGWPHWPAPLERQAAPGRRLRRQGRRHRRPRCGGGFHRRPAGDHRRSGVVPSGPLRGAAFRTDPPGVVWRDSSLRAQGHGRQGAIVRL